MTILHLFPLSCPHYLCFRRALSPQSFAETEHVGNGSNPYDIRRIHSVATAILPVYDNLCELS